MSLLDGLGLRARDGLAEARVAYAKLRRAVSAFGNTKIVVAAPGSKATSNGTAVSNGAAHVAGLTPAPAPVAPPAEVPETAPIPPPVAVAVAEPPAAPIAPVPKPTVLPKPSPTGSVIRRSEPVFAPPSSGDPHSTFSLRTDARQGKMFLGESGGARLHEARRLNGIAIVGVTVGVVNLIVLIVAIAFAGFMLKNATSATKDAEGTAKIDQRAWIGLGDAALQTPYSKAKIGMTLALENTGKTPATIDGIDIHVTSYEPATNRTTTISDRHIGSRSIAPNNHESLSIAEPKPLTAAQFSLLVSHRIRHQFAVTVRYRDIFGDTHQTEICKAIEGTASDMAFGNAFASCDPNSMQ